MATKITATELARNLSDVLNRVRYKGESFIVERNGETVAEIKAPEKKRGTVGDLINLLENGPKPDPEFWDDVEEAHRQLNQPLPPPRL
jgi:antitoxin (DNA-binding transcriptional repressor) of toxin-antitoxin stability system